MDLLLGLVLVYQLLSLGLVSGANGLLGLGISHARASKNLLGSFAGLCLNHHPISTMLLYMSRLL